MLDNAEEISVEKMFLVWTSLICIYYYQCDCFAISTYLYYFSFCVDSDSI